MKLHDTVGAVTARILQRSAHLRFAYLRRLDAMAQPSSRPPVARDS